MLWWNGDFLNKALISWARISPPPGCFCWWTITNSAIQFSDCANVVGRCSLPGKSDFPGATKLVDVYWILLMTYLHLFAQPKSVMLGFAPPFPKLLDIFSFWTGGLLKWGVPQIILQTIQLLGYPPLMETSKWMRSPCPKRPWTPVGEKSYWDVRKQQTAVKVTKGTAEGQWAGDVIPKIQ